MNNPQSILTNFFGVAIRSQTYQNLVYLCLAFPLGLLYFVLLVIGFSLGFGLLTVWVGPIILSLAFVGLWTFATFERQMATRLLHEEIPPIKHSPTTSMRTWDRIKPHLANPATWKSLAYLLAKFPLGVLTFTVLVTLITLILAFMAAPVIYRFFPMEVEHFGISAILIDTPWKAIVSLCTSAALLFSTLHITNSLARISGRFAQAMLS
ncbi:MAG: sensor domain-containing protein [Anaerolineales bacterium]|jgi:hypothetical protein|nr:sensor domain-containing protein [Anaerolineales bacterium]